MLHLKTEEPNFWSFDGTHKIALVTNHRPEVRGIDHAIWRRLRLIPFTVTFEGQDKDLDLPEKLAAERSGILNWMLSGCLEWQRNGLQDPPEVIKETANYRAAEDVVGQFLQDRCRLNPNVNDSSTELYGPYKVWAENCGERPMSSKAFCGAMRDREFEEYRSNGVRFKGVAVKPEYRQHDSCRGGSQEY